MATRSIKSFNEHHSDKECHPEPQAKDLRWTRKTTHAFNRTYQDLSPVMTKARQCLTLILSLALFTSPLPAQQSTGYTFRAETDLVLVNVTVRDKSGNLVRDLKQSDFSVVEDNKPQQ